MPQQTIAVHQERQTRADLKIVNLSSTESVQGYDQCFYEQGRR